MKINMFGEKNLMYFSTDEGAAGGGPEIDLAAIEAEIGTMSDEDIQAELLKVRVRQKKQQKKMQNSPSHKAYQLKAQAKRKALVALAKKKGLYEKVNEQAETIVAQQQAEEAADLTEQD